MDQLNCQLSLPHSGSSTTLCLQTAYNNIINIWSKVYYIVLIVLHIVYGYGYFTMSERFWKTVTENVWELWFYKSSIRFYLMHFHTNNLPCVAWPDCLSCFFFFSTGALKFTSTRHLLQNTFAVLIFQKHTPQVAACEHASITLLLQEKTSLRCSRLKVL